MINNPIFVQQGTALPTLTSPGTSSDLLSGKQLIDQDGNIVTGSMSTITQATPSISVSSSGLITATSTQSTSGYLSSGTTSATSQLTTQAAKTVTPTTSSQTAVAASRYTTGAVTVAGASTLIASNIKSGVSIFGVTGTYTGPDVLYTYPDHFEVTVSGTTVTCSISFGCSLDIMQKYFQVGSDYPYMDGVATFYNYSSTHPIVQFYTSDITLYYPYGTSTYKSVSYSYKYFTSMSEYDTGCTLLTFSRTVSSSTLSYIEEISTSFRTGFVICSLTEIPYNQ